jgi:hypothetical protein
MDVSVKLTVFFEEMFWVGVFERSSGEIYEISKVTFGPEPKDYEVYDFILKNFAKLNFGKVNLTNEVSSLKNKSINPKRLQRKIKKETQTIGLGTKAQIALKLQHESNKLIRKVLTKEEKELAKDKKFELRQQKKLSKHKGH